MKSKKFKPVSYRDLNSRQQENFNFQKVAAHLADYGFNCLRLSDDWQGADFIACHVNGETFLKVQLKGRLTFEKKYEGKAIHIAFLHKNECYVYPHDELLNKLIKQGKLGKSDHWKKNGIWSWSNLPSWAKEILSEYKV
jgi:hypothetical protein